MVRPGVPLILILVLVGARAWGCVTGGRGGTGAPSDPSSLSPAKAEALLEELAVAAMKDFACFGSHAFTGPLDGDGWDRFGSGLLPGTVTSPWGRTQLSSVAAAADCQAILGLGTFEVFPSCTDGVNDTIPAVCEGAVARYCTDDAGVRHMREIDCATFDLDCIEMPASGGAEAWVTCGIPGESLYEQFGCRGDQVVSGATVVTDCSAFGATCQANPGTAAVPGCAPAGGACQDEAKARCEGTSIVTCVRSVAVRPVRPGSDAADVADTAGQIHSFDCAKASAGRRTCDDEYLDDRRLRGSVSGVFEIPAGCAPAGTACEEGSSSCDGAVLVLCPDGFAMRIDCVKWGFDGCGPRSGHVKEFTCLGWPEVPGGSPCEELADACEQAGEGDAAIRDFCANVWIEHPEESTPWVCAWKLDACRSEGLCPEHVTPPCACGDGTCAGGCGETLETCPGDCAACGDGTCSPGETQASCPKDCCGGCGDRHCDPLCGETLAVCPYDCKACGDGTCSPSEGPVECPEDCCGGCGDQSCRGYACGESAATCPGDCTWPCGDKVCQSGETPALCAMDCAWKACGNGICEGGESIEACAIDCASACGDCECQGDENWLDCPIDCGYCGDGVCSPCGRLNESEAECPKDCGKGAEVCNGLDDDADGATDEEGAAGCVPHFADGDHDGFGAGAARCLCRPDGTFSAALPTDCDDADPARRPGGAEVCDGKDNDCDGESDEGATCPGGGECTAGKCPCLDVECEGTCCKHDETCFGGKCCKPACTGKECGGDQCGGTCGTCDAAKPICHEGSCVACLLPSAWAPTGVLSSLVTPTDKPEIEAKCTDFTADGKGDNGLALLASFVNPEFASSIANGTMVVLFEFDGAKTLTNSGPFTLNELSGKHVSAGGPGGDYNVLATSYGEQCLPRFGLEPATIAGGTLQAGPGRFELAVPWNGMPLALSTTDASLRGSVAAGAGGGVDLANGVLAGLVSRQELEARLAGLEVECQKPGPPSWCSYIPLAKQVLPMASDIDTDADGQKDALSVCGLVTFEAARIVGVQ